MKVLYRLTEEEIVELTDVLSETYSIAVAVFYEAYITLLKKEIAYYLKSLGEHI